MATGGAPSSSPSSSWSLQKLQDFVPQASSQYKAFEDAFVKKAIESLINASEHPTMVFGVAIASGLLLMRGPRRFLVRQTLGRLQTEEALFIKAEKSIDELNKSCIELSNGAKKVIAHTHFAEGELQRGKTKIRDTGREIQRLVKSIYKIESQATDLKEGLRALPGRTALQLRAEVASMAYFLKQRRSELDKRILKIAELGIKV